MDHRDEFSKWMKSVEEALSAENKGLAESLPPPTNSCGCGEWSCTVCFPSQDDFGSVVPPEDNVVFGGTDIHGIEPTPPDMPQQQPGMGLIHTHDHEMCSDLEAGMNDIEFDMLGLKEVGIETNEFDDDEDIIPARETVEKSRDGKGVKLGDIVTKTEFRKTGGENSPLTYSQGLEEGPNDDLDIRDADFDGPEELEMGSPLSRREYVADLEQIDPDEALNMIGSILYMQDMGLSKGSRHYTEQDLSSPSMNAGKLKKIHAEVMGTVAEAPAMTRTYESAKQPVRQKSPRPAAEITSKLQESVKPQRARLSLLESLNWHIKLKEAFAEIEEELVDESTLSRLLGKQQGGQNLVKWLHRRHRLSNDADLVPASFSERIFWKQFKSHPDTFVIVSAQNGVAGIKPDKKFIDARIAEFAKKGKTYNPSGDSTLPYQIVAFTSDGEQVDPELLRPPKEDGEEDYRDPRDPTVMRARMGKHSGKDMQNPYNVFNLLADQIGALKTVWISGFENAKDAGPGSGSVERDKMKKRADLKAPPAVDEQKAIMQIAARLEPALTGLLTKINLPAGFDFEREVAKAVETAAGSGPGTDDFKDLLQAAAKGNAAASKPIYAALKQNLASMV